MRLFLLTTVLAFSSIGVYAADSAQEQYDAIKSQTSHTGAAGFDARHKAYSKYIMQNRRDEAGSVLAIEPAAGDEQEDVTSSVSYEPSERVYND